CDGVADDANAWPVADPHEGVWLRIARHGGAYAFHAGVDGQRWEFVRNFAIGSGPAQVGFVAQAPTGSGCNVVFDHIEYAPSAPSDLRDGS
ncbi:DUF1349 domain-containing protein, partial [Saccharopolyspora thermophila]